MNTAAVVIVARADKYKRLFRRAGATSPGTAIVPEVHGIRKSFVFHKLVRDGVLRSDKAGRYYLDEGRSMALHTKRQKLVLVILCFILILALFGFFATRR